jgi:hypothetical protein
MSAPDNDENDQIQDPEEYVSRRRLEDIFEARRQLRHQRLVVHEHREDESEFKAAKAYRSAFSNYLLEIEPLMRIYEPGPHLLYEKDYGSVTISPRLETDESGYGTTHYVTVPDGILGTREVEVPEPPEPVTHRLQGLNSVFTLPSPVTEKFVLETPHSMWDDDSRTVTETAEINLATLDEMIRDTNNFLAEIGFELDPDTGPDEWEIEV